MVLKHFQLTSNEMINEIVAKVLEYDGCSMRCGV